MSLISKNKLLDDVIILLDMFIAGGSEKIPTSSWLGGAMYRGPNWGLTQVGLIYLYHVN